ncbi:threonine/serine dehydratase [Maricaulis sp.]|uniref:threonine ammonia-lyase n=1 Tax=Maricaulis sp. TaxID=1486257 RepID=UPI0026390D39|nr:threonine/serine dehydratase [Maricaulis sp.]
MLQQIAPPSYENVADAARRLAGHAVRTPLLRNDLLDDLTGARIFVKAECLQRTGSFKFRGAFNRISRLSDAEKARGVIAYSSGNHAQGVAAAARLNGTSAKILMPTDAPRSKVDGVTFWGGEVISFDRATQSREEMGRAIAEAEGRILVPPYEDPFIIAGQGTAGLEAAEQLAEYGAGADMVICGAGGGGLIAGVGLAMLHHHPATQIFVAEPEGFDDHGRSLASGRRETNDRLTGSICDAIITPTPGELTWSLNAQQLAGSAAVSDEDALDAMAFAWRHLKIVTEPGGIVALAAVLSGKLDVAGRTVCVFATGGNVDRAMFTRALERA